MRRVVSLILFLILSFAASSVSFSEDAFENKRKSMVEKQIIARGVKDSRVIKAMSKIPRHLFVSEELKHVAYEDAPLPIGFAQTISQPYIVAFMTEVLALKKNDKVLEIGTGSGYQAAVLAEIVKEVYTIEILLPLAEKAEESLAALGYDNISVRCGDGYLGWPEEAPFDAIIITAAPPEIPQELVEQLKVGGRMVVPVGSFFQELYLITKTDRGITKKALLPVKFVPMVRGE